MTLMEARMHESLQPGGMIAFHAAIDNEAIWLYLFIAVNVPCHDGLSAVVHVPVEHTLLAGSVHYRGMYNSG